ncbi:zinc transporter ZIP1-like [Homarus americanus]|uniref:Zinc transporter ZIP3-like 1 n=1 Tax=Homarus americanus TaxID=6706 RepID=A0A8J5T257_HOMAM|nr:zinc transporter ZIP1-like [Homarus americanus]KAG7171959.1 Zinc transporter ZIP3-like 1 [Homarus americanus]
MLNLVETKVMVLLTMAILSFAFSLLPLLVRKVLAGRFRTSSSQNFMSGCLCFGGGVLMATVFLHLLPETRVYLQLATTSGFLPHVPYPLSELIVCCGFFFMYISEELVHSCLYRNGHSHLLMHGHQGMEMSEETETTRRKKFTYSKNDVNIDGESIEKMAQNKGSAGEAGEVVDALKPGDGGFSVMRAVVVVMALSLHSIMEGLALGLVHTPMDAWLLFAAICSHKLIIAFCMGMELLEAKASLTAFLLSMVIFSLASPMGGILGTVVVSMMTGKSAAEVIVPTVLQGLSAGTILYVTFCEVLERERAKSTNSYVKMLTLIIGFIFMAALQVVDMFVPDDPITEATNSPPVYIYPSLPPHRDSV